MLPFARLCALLCLLAGCSRPSADAAPASGAKPSPHPRPFSIASWNIEWLNRAEGKGEVPRQASDYARLAEHARKLDVDVVALQEVDGEQAARRVFDPAVYDFHFASDVGTTQRAGFAWRKTWRAIPHPDVTGLAESGPRRGADLEVELGGRRIRLLSIHLKSGCQDRALDSGDPSCSTLAAQIPALEEWIDARAREGVPYAVLGDFNRRFVAGDELWSAIDDGDPPGATLVDAGTVARLSALIDHIVVGGTATSWLAPGSFRHVAYSPDDLRAGVKLSDHRPIVVTLDPSRVRSEAAPDPVPLRAAQARDHVGELATVCGVVASARHVAARRAGPTFLNLDRAYPDQIFTVFIPPADRQRFDRPELAYARKRICVTGTIDLHDGKAQIVASDPSQISLAQ